MRFYLFSERVEPPVLTVNSNSTINDTCNVTVTCRGQNTSVTSSCNNRTCSQVGGESRGAETSTVPLLSVYVAGGSIICNHSNQVSWANDTKDIVELCPMKSVSSSVFVEKGQDVRLDVQGYMTVKENLKRLNIFTWMFNTSDNVVTYIHEIETQVTRKYQGRAEFIEGNFSLLLKNLTEGDSGCYTAAVSAKRNKDVAKYQISVQERVEPPVLTVNSVSSINTTCNVTVTCRGQNTSVTSSCNSRTCSQSGTKQTTTMLSQSGYEVLSSSSLLDAP
uniref:Immunoglobulin V-set domain-containing protein n=1 Tax=Hucho hucho TaxID=62062 RepID=A0A4W5LPM7_9TELE